MTPDGTRENVIRDLRKELSTAEEALKSAAEILRLIGDGKIRPTLAGSFGLRFDLSAMTISEALKHLK